MNAKTTPPPIETLAARRMDYVAIASWGSITAALLAGIVIEQRSPSLGWTAAYSLLALVALVTIPGVAIGLAWRSIRGMIYDVENRIRDHINGRREKKTHAAHIKKTAGQTPTGPDLVAFAAEVSRLEAEDVAEMVITAEISPDLMDEIGAELLNLTPGSNASRIIFVANADAGDKSLVSNITTTEGPQ